VLKGLLFLFKKIFLLAFLLLFIGNAFAIIQKDDLSIYAVTTEGEGLVANLTLEIEPGTGKVWSAVTPLVGTTTQNAEREAVRLASNFSKDSKKYDYKFTITSSASIVEGPSAGAAMALLTASMLTDRKIPDEVSITGTIDSDGTVGPVGGVFEKAKEASKTGVKLFLIPRGEAVQTVRLQDGVRSVNLLEYAPQQWGLTVVEVDTLADAMELAFLDIKDIDVNASAVEIIPDFVPEKINLPNNLGSFKILTTNYINETKQITSEARNALSSSLLEDPSATEFLLQTLNSAEQTLSNAEILNEQNYLYSAANFAFLARVDAVLVKEVSVNPSLLKSNSTALDLKLFELRQEINNFEVKLSGPVPKDGLEWFVSAQQRFTYARLTVDRLLSEKTVVVDGVAEDDVLIALKNLQDYSFAVSWLDVSKDFYNISAETKDYVAPSSIFEADASAAISEAELSYKKLAAESDRSDILRRIDSAKNEFEKGWFEAAWVDAVSAKALSDSELASSGIGNEDLAKSLQTEILNAEKKLADANSGIGWASLYLDHAKYFLSAGGYYKELQANRSISSLQSGLSLAYLSESTLEVSEKIIVAYSALESVKEDQKPVKEGTANEPPYYIGILILGLMIVLVLLLIFLFGTMKQGKARHFTVMREIAELKRDILVLDKQLLEGKISNGDYDKRKSDKREALDFLEEERKDMLRHMYVADDYSSEIDSYSERISGLKKHYRERVISKAEFSEKLNQYLGSISSLKKSLESELKLVLDKKSELQGADAETLLKKRKKLLPAIVKQATKKEVKSKEPAKNTPSPKGKPPSKTASKKGKGKFAYKK